MRVKGWANTDVILWDLCVSLVCEEATVLVECLTAGFYSDDQVASVIHAFQIDGEALDRS